MQSWRVAQAPDLGFIHRFIPAADVTRPPLLLLHGTGADENDLIPLGEMLSPGSALLSPRGKVLEDGTTLRFFRRKLLEGLQIHLLDQLAMQADLCLTPSDTNRCM
jgi:predicted esterase